VNNWLTAYGEKMSFSPSKFSTFAGSLAQAKPDMDYPTVTPEFLQDVFLSRCKDLGERVSAEQAETFLRTVTPRCKGMEYVIMALIAVGGVVGLRSTFLGVNASVSVAGGLKTVNVKKLDFYGNRTCALENSVVHLTQNCAMLELWRSCNYAARITVYSICFHVFVIYLV